VSHPRAAYCDVDGTLSATQIASPLIFFKRRLTPRPLRALWMGCLPLRAAYWLLLDKFSREASNRAIYAGYAGLNVERLKALAPECYRSYLEPRLLSEGLQRLKRLKEEGMQLVLVTGSLDFLMKPLAVRLGAEVVAPSLEVRDGYFTGRLTGPVMTGERKALAVRAHAQRLGIDLQASFAFGDALGDLPMLECVGRPVAVNPGRRLAAQAARRGWPIERWR
jgi:HAD superfamily hydrolase (TIGR01490 family)